MWGDCASKLERRYTCLVYAVRVISSFSKAFVKAILQTLAPPCGCVMHCLTVTVAFNCCRTWMRRTRWWRERRRWLWQAEKEVEEEEEGRMICSLSRSMKFHPNSLTLSSKLHATARLRISYSRWVQEKQTHYINKHESQQKAHPNIFNFLCFLARLCQRLSIPTVSSLTPIHATTCWWRKWPRTSALRSPRPPSLFSECCWITSVSTKLRAAGGARESLFLNSKSR